MACFQVYTTGAGTFDFITQRGVHLAFGVTLIVMMKPLAATLWAGKREMSAAESVISLAVDLLLIFGVWLGVYWAQVEYMTRLTSISGTTWRSIAAGMLLLIIVLEIARRTVGYILPILSIVMILYAVFGPYMPYAIRHRGYSFDRILQFLVSGSDGLFGSTLGVSATTVFIFVLFGSFLEASGANAFINDSVMYAAGKRKSGPAIAAVIASALMGTINGTAVANVVGTGTFTIPMMKKKGYPAPFAGSVEAVASTGGQILPPVMGAGAFLMVSFTETKYSEIICAAAIPALLYFGGAFLSVVFASNKYDLTVMTAEEREQFHVDWRKAWIYLPPIVVLIVCLLILNISANLSAFWSIIAILVITAFFKAERFTPKKLFLAMVDGARSSLIIVAGCACAGLVVAMVSQTGLGIAFSDMVLSVAGTSIFLTLLMTAFACIVLGMGLPTTASYVIAAAVVVPAMLKLGSPLLASHLFVFYFACLSTITPPVALASYAAAGIAKCDPMRCAWESCKLGFAGFIVPFMFIYNDVLLLNGSVFDVAYSSLTAMVGVALMAAGSQGYFLRRCGMLERIALLAGGLGMVHPSAVTDMIGVGIISIVVIFQYIAKKKEAAAAA